MKPKSQNITKTCSKVTKEDKEKLLNQKGAVFWMSGLSGSGKSTLAHEVERKLTEEGNLVVVLDGDNVRHGLNADLGFSAEERAENLRRIAEVAKLFAENGIIVITSFISPTQDSRDNARKIISKTADFYEVFVKCDIKKCKSRDPKGLYKKVEAGEIKNFTGIDAPFEEADDAEVVIDTGEETLEESAEGLVAFVREEAGLQ